MLQLPEYLTKEVLWKGSMLSLKAQFMGEQEFRRAVGEHLARLERCDDLTDNERSFAKALQRYWAEG